MKARLDHIGIAVSDIDMALKFYRDALGLEIETSEEVASQRVRAHFIPLSPGAGDAALELLEATADDSPIAKYIAKRGPGLHHIAIEVEGIESALALLKAQNELLHRVHLVDGAPNAIEQFFHRLAEGICGEACGIKRAVS